MRTLFVLAIAVAGCSSGAFATSELASHEQDAVATEPPAKAAVAGGSANPWEADARWRRRAADVESAARSAWAPASSATGFAFDRGREPLIAYDAAAPTEGDVVLRFVDGVRRPVVRLQPQALLRGEFVMPDDLGPLAATASLLSAANERAVPAWVVAGGGIVCGGAFERRLHVRALGGIKVISRESDLFGSYSDDPLAAAARVKALLRIARGERPLQRFAAALLDGHDEDTALALVGVADRAFLDAAAGTERARAASSIADDPELAWLATQRDKLGRGEVDGSDAVADHASAATDGRNPWIAADVSLQKALIALVTGDVGQARKHLDAAPPSRVVRTQERRIVEALVAPPQERAEATRVLLEDWPRLATTQSVLRTLVMYPPVPK